MWIGVRKAYGDYEDWSDPYRNEDKRVAGLRPTRQTKLYNFDPLMAHPKWDTDLAAIRIHDEENVLGGGLHPTEQGEANIDFERGQTNIDGIHLPPRYTDDDMVDIEDRGVEYRLRPDGKVEFKLKEGDRGLWLAKPTVQDAYNLYSHRSPDYLTFIRGKSGSLRGQGKAHERGSDESKENVAEMFLQRKKPIDPDRLVHMKIRNQEHAAKILDKLGIGRRGSGKRRTWKDHKGEEREISRWDDESDIAKPMKKSLQLLKERKSPEAWAHKLEYDKKYQKTPKRVKYREQLNAERRKRGIYGKGGKDVSHTQGGKLTLENPSSNRARHFKNRGTLRRVKVR